MTEMTMVQAVNKSLRDAMREDEDVVILGEDVGVNGGVFRCTADLHKEFGEARVIEDANRASAALVRRATARTGLTFGSLAGRLSGLVSPA